MINSRYHVENLLSEFNRANGTDLQFEGDCCVFEYTSDGEECILTHSETDDILYFQSPLVIVMAEEKQQAFRTLLEWNLNGQATHGTTLALEKTSDLVVLCHQETASLVTPERFPELLTGFLDAADELREKVKTIAHDIVPPEDEGVPLDSIEA